MDSTAQKSQGQNQGDDQKQQPFVSVSGGIGKEVERPVSDFITHSEKPPVLDEELKQAGVEVVSQKPELTDEHEKLGVTHSLENNTPSLEPKGTVKLPMTKDEAEKIVDQDKGKVSSDIGEHTENIYVSPSALFLARLVLKHLKKIKNLFSKN